jgi:hypothetical protein
LRSPDDKAEPATLPNRRRLLAQIASGDLDITIIGKLPPTHPPCRDQLEPGPLLAKADRVERAWDRQKFL